MRPGPIWNGSSWGDISFEDKRHVVDLMISVIYATSEKIDIIWKF